MNKLLIAVAVLLTVSSVCDAYGQIPAYGARPAALPAAIVYQNQPGVTIQILIPASAYAGSAKGPQASSGYGTPLQSGYGTPSQSGYGTPLQSGYGTPSQSGYGTPLQSGYGAPIGLLAPPFRKVAPIGYDSEIIRLAELALSLPSLPAIVDESPDLAPSNIYGPTAPLILPSSIGGGYKISAYAPEVASASAVADSAGKRLGNTYAPASVVSTLGINVGPASGSSYAPSPRPVIRPAKTPTPAAGY